MYTDLDYNTSTGIWVSFGFFAGISYTTNQFRESKNTFSYSVPKHVSVYDKVFDIEELPINEIRNDNTILILNWPITLKMENNEEVFIVSNDDLNLHGIGFSKEDALSDFNSSFIHFWNYYMEIDENKIIGYAKRLKALFTNIVKE